MEKAKQARQSTLLIRDMEVGRHNRRADHARRSREAESVATAADIRKEVDATIASWPGPLKELLSTARPISPKAYEKGHAWAIGATLHHMREAARMLMDRSIGDARAQATGALVAHRADPKSGHSKLAAARKEQDSLMQERAAQRQAAKEESEAELRGTLEYISAWYKDKIDALDRRIMDLAKKAAAEDLPFEAALRADVEAITKRYDLHTELIKQVAQDSEE